ncbi:nitrogen fixation protein NifQ [Pseudogemmobacter blasticus]|uniref:Nitrogen fixation protein NifQ n=1 Tax=Fuscovulum blasticum DSM 2131 TaxID=1188250 RepID=A0A2T4JCV8_FUSBL|nr:nitrogen fixation protein NifQ [Fuscovulum blasticum]PTE15744.1 nitrogen fixation protein NifQ [Fuscovulum blasticum DSM 2131]
MPLRTEARVAPPEGAAESRRDFGEILAHALAERAAGRGSLPVLLGVDGPDLATLRDRWAPGLALPDLTEAAPAPLPEQQAVITLILWRAGRADATARALARIIARRALEPRHLWEDLGLSNRPALTALIARHLPGLAAANGQKMRWKKFLYRQVCLDDGLSLCLSPVCDDCPEWALCFAPEEAATPAAPATAAHP